MLGHSLTSSLSSMAPPTSGGTLAITVSNAAWLSARRSRKSSPLAGTTLNASPLFMIVGTALSCLSPPGSWQPATRSAA